MNETLEEMARALFKSWFVDFDPVRAKMEGREPVPAAGGLGAVPRPAGALGAWRDTGGVGGEAARGLLQPDNGPIAPR